MRELAAGRCRQSLRGQARSTCSVGGGRVGHSLQHAAGEGARQQALRLCRASDGRRTRRDNLQRCADHGAQSVFAFHLAHLPTEIAGDLIEVLVQLSELVEDLLLISRDQANQLQENLDDVVAASNRAKCAAEVAAVFDDISDDLKSARRSTAMSRANFRSGGRA